MSLGREYAAIPSKWISPRRSYREALATARGFLKDTEEAHAVVLVLSRVDFKVDQSFPDPPIEIQAIFKDPPISEEELPV